MEVWLFPSLLQGREVVWRAVRVFCMCVHASYNYCEWRKGSVTWWGGVHH